MTATEQRLHCASQLLGAATRIPRISGFVGLDGFVDEIVHVVNKRSNADAFDRVNTITELGRRITSAAGHSSNIELVNQRTKLGGNGPILANALTHLGLNVTYLGALGYPNRHPVFDDFASRAEVHSIAEAGHTDALEFADGKIMLTKTTQLNEVTWDNIQARFGREHFMERFSGADLVSFVNWTMVPHMNELWEALLRECIALPTPPDRRKIFFDLADPEKRTPKDILRALELIKQFERFFEVTLGLNEREALTVAQVLGLKAPSRDPETLGAVGRELQHSIGISNLVIHPVTWALAVSGGIVSRVEGPVVHVPLITTGAGDHFNAGFCLGNLLGFDNTLSLLTGVASSAFYVRNAASPTVPDLITLLQTWPEKQS